MKKPIFMLSAAILLSSLSLQKEKKVAAQEPTKSEEVKSEKLLNNDFMAHYSAACEALDIAQNAEQGKGVNFQKRVAGPQEFELPLVSNFLDKPIEYADESAEKSLGATSVRKALALIGVELPKSRIVDMDFDLLYHNAAFNIFPARRQTTVEEIWEREVVVSNDDFQRLGAAREKLLRKALIIFSEYHQRSQEAWKRVQTHDPALISSMRKMLNGMVGKGQGASKAEEVKAIHAFRERKGINSDTASALEEALALMVDAQDIVKQVDKAIAIALKDAGPWMRATRVQMKGGEILLGGIVDDQYNLDGKEILIVDIGGDDSYKGNFAAAGFGSPLRVLIDYKGDDTYRRNTGAVGMASGHCGFGTLIDKAGNDLYQAGDFSLGAGCFGIGILEDYAGEDTYKSGQMTQGAGYAGVGMLIDRGVADKDGENTDRKLSNDKYQCDRYGQGFGYVAGYGALRDTGGNDQYNAGGRYRHTPLLPDSFQSLSQGMGFGSRGNRFGGGIGVLDDQGTGNDTYNAEVYGQGASYWYAFGILRDGGGNDRYTLTQYGQGAGIHLSGGMLIDQGGNDNYYNFNGVGTGGAHDYAVGILIDQGGNDAYYSNGLAQGLNNSVALLYDVEGDDSYSSRAKNGIGFAHNLSIAFLIDGGGKDQYSIPMQDGLWKYRGNHGVIVDHLSEEEWKKNPPALVSNSELRRQLPEKEESAPVKETVKPKRPAPVVGADKQNRDKATLEKLWAKACEWQVGTEENKLAITNARRTLVEEGNLPFLITKLSESYGLNLRALQATIPHFGEAAIAPMLKELEKPENYWRFRNSFDLITRIYQRQARAEDKSAATKHIEETLPKMIAGYQRIDQSRRFTFLDYMSRYNSGDKVNVEITPLLKPFLESEQDRTRLAAFRLAVKQKATPELFAALHIAAVSDPYHAVRHIATNVKAPEFKDEAAEAAFYSKLHEMLEESKAQENEEGARPAPHRGLVNIQLYSMSTTATAKGRSLELLLYSATDADSCADLIRKASRLAADQELEISASAIDAISFLKEKMLEQDSTRSAADFGAFAELYALIADRLEE